LKVIPALRALGLGAILTGALVLVACGNDDDGGSVSVEGTGSASSSPSASGTGSGSASASGTGSASASGTGSTSASGEEAKPGVVEQKPSGATEVDVTLKEFAIASSQATVPAGNIYFLVDNQGPEDPHEFVVIKTDLAPDALPVEEGMVPEEEVDLIDEIEPFTPTSKASLTLDLQPGKYVFICNIAEMENGELESHYQEGMRTAFTVQ
jgi:uncharacterized cupredoxin-like copper-binding protein